MTRVRRFDTYDASVLKPPTKLPNGWLRVSGRIARVGIQEYADGAGKVRRELREPDQVFNDQAMASFALVPLTNTHPTVLLDAQTATKHTVGAVSAPVRDGDWLVADMLITDADAVAAALAGRNELSCGYEAEIDETPGVHPLFGSYDCRQINISGNHLALVDEARAGHQATLRLDSGDAAMVRSTLRETQPTEPLMLSIVIAGKRVDLTEANIAQVQATIDSIDRDLKGAVTGRATAQKIALKWLMRHLDEDEAGDDDEPGDEMVDCAQCDGKGKMPVAGEDDKMVGCDACDGKGKVAASSLGNFGADEDDGETAEMAEEAKGDVDELEVEQETEKEAGKSHKDWKGRRDARRAKRRKDALQRRKDGVAKFADAIRTRVAFESRQRAGLEAKARKVLGADVDLTKLDDAGVRKATIAKAFPEFKADGKSADVLADRFEQAVEKSGTIEPTHHADSARGAVRSPSLLPTVPAGNGAAGARARIDAARQRRNEKLQGMPFNKVKAAEHVAAKKN